MERRSDRVCPISPILSVVLLAGLCVGSLVSETLRASTGRAVVENLALVAVLVLLFGALVRRLVSNRWDLGTALLGLAALAFGLMSLFEIETVLRSEVVYVLWVASVPVQLRAVGRDTEFFTETHGVVLAVNGLAMVAVGLAFGGSVGVLAGSVVTAFGLVTVSDPNWLD
ncbi:hypothetical protein [Halorussus amylolyticus]|uniref:hypothetical protein n=1 Tax=Halorussus amylolyticus TaxID=1126242 RepID=UPI001047B54B|nr:hypothetical protein [Halorussus amylolyticus]